MAIFFTGYGAATGTLYGTGTLTWTGYGAATGTLTGCGTLTWTFLEIR